MKKRSVILMAVMLMVMLAGILPAQQAQQVYVRDVLDSPQKYYNLTVQITGEVTRVVTPQTPSDRGYYELLDNSDKTIRVVANTLPAPQTQVTVVGIVQISPSNQEAYIREANRFGDVPQPGAGTTLPPPQEKPDYLMYALIGLIAVIVVVLLAVLLRKPAGAPQAAQVAPTTIPPMEPSVAAPSPVQSAKATKQVSTHEVNQAVGGLRTKAVPDPLAQIVVLVGPNQGKGYPLGYETTLGRVTGDIILEDESVSRKHARIVFAKRTYTVENLSQTNPVIVNSQRIESSKELSDGDEIICGTVKLQFKLL